MNSQYHIKYMLAGLVLYTFLIIYGTLYPIEQWDWSLGNWAMFLTLKMPQSVSYADLVMNFIIYIPLGFFLHFSLHSIKSHFYKLLIITIIGFFLSTTLEYLQQFLPGRTSSLSDIFLNTIGALLGALCAFILSKKNIRVHLTHWKHEHLSHTPYSLLGMTAALLWGSSQLVPFVPSLEFSNLRHGLAPFWNTLVDIESLKISKLIINSLYISSIFLILRASLKKTAWATQFIFLFILAILLLKIPIVSRQLSLEASIGFFIGLLTYSIFYRLNVRILKIIALILLASAYAYESLLSGDLSLASRPMNWIPFSQQMNTLIGVADLIEQIALFAAISFLLSPKTLKPEKSYLILTGIAVSLFAFIFEWLQQFIPGRYSDITDVIIAFATWMICILYPWNSHRQPHYSTPKAEIGQSLPFKSRYLMWFLIPLGLILALSYLIKTPFNTSYTYKLPEISALPSVHLSNFNLVHPRLPAPSRNDIKRLESENKHFFKRHKKLAEKGKLYSRMLIAYVYPGEINLLKLFNDVMALQPTWRGHKQTKPIVLAYDWLYSQWSPEQRKQLRTKVKEACDYQIYAIRDKYQLSPYNVFLYNSPLQALVAASLVLHKDIPEPDDTCMRFTHDYWTNRVIPVWQQIMGQNGGWHEGGEYIGIGIGQAIYQIPAMWRNATGEDYFTKVPGITGFLDFLVYRTRPDGTHFRWGDAANFDKAVPDRLPLAIDFQHRAAFNIKPTKKLQPTSWPWGPLTDNNLIDDQANNQLPLTKFFDGIGLLVSRTNWDNDATYVTFKAGNNYWSHSHLDQGAFTIFKGGPLAIDSGLYGPQYGSDHHMNYTYQSIAHNVVTVTDPEDTIPLPSKKRKNSKKQAKQKSREIANDGGQRRVGSGWGKSAPIDLQDWLNQSDIYHTSTIDKIIEKDNIVAVIADLTSAYTNTLSGKDTFAHRSKRIKSYKRIFIHDKTNDIILIFDKINAFKAKFRKKWLLHSLLEPMINEQYFQINAPENSKLNMKVGTLKGKILLPEKFFVNKIGGKGMEFYVDGVNYDENGRLFKSIKRKKNAEPGEWRLELEPFSSDKENIFLVAMQASFQHESKPLPKITVQKKETQIICEVIGNNRITFVFPQNLEQMTYSISQF